MRYKNIFAIFMMLTGVLFASCTEEFFEPELSSSKSTDQVSSINDLNALLYGALTRMSEPELYGRDLIILGDIRSDNALSNGKSGRFVTDNQFVYTSNGARALDVWTKGYEVIASANIIINSETEDKDTPEVKYVKGQAYALRALMHMNLLTLYGQQYTGGTEGVPIVTKFLENFTPVRSPVQEVWEQIGADIEEARKLVDPELDPNTSTVPGSMMVEALASRYFLYTENWEKAKEAALNVINANAYSLISSAGYASNWVKDETSNAIFEIGMNDTDNADINGLYQILGNTNYGDVEITTDLYEQFEAGDARKTIYSKSDGVHRSLKHIAFSTNVKVFTYAEVLLNYAEALMRLNDPEALNALNVIPVAMGATPYAVANEDNVLLERRKELAMEGFRFYDLMRTQRDIPKVDPRQRYDDGGIPYGSSKLVLPIPQAEIDANPQIAQNKDY
ncbi:RagB/SusD family nutrient uptake outer membrane protein [Rapidithrix thailandica]|uniref:RagB/SusD family nutrient uptake outer membrane protein n=1 Tax=Rapidithrix thailandica TaxID=413964 RepID=A0AAW9SAL8_9BACT